MKLSAATQRAQTSMPFVFTSGARLVDRALVGLLSTSTKARKWDSKFSENDWSLLRRLLRRWTEPQVGSLFCPLSSHVCAETRQQMLKRGSRFYVQAVCNSLSMTHTLSHTYTHTHTHTTRTGDMLDRREHVLLSTPFARAVLQTSRERLNSSSGSDSDAFFESSAWMQAPDHISRRRSKTSTSLKQTLKRCKKNRHMD